MRKVVLAVLFIFAVTSVYAFRISKPQIFSLPWTQDQVNQLNDALEDLWNLQNGEFNLDIVTTTKSNADNGDIWLIQTGVIVYLQYKANNRVYTITPDGF